MLLGSAAHATMPTLTGKPKPASPIACKDWAAKQDEEAINMWGIQEDGTSPKAVALERLSNFCLGKGSPAIVGFGSSAGFNDAYCKKRPRTKICVDHKNSR
jgi:hypothetical protein